MIGSVTRALSLGDVRKLAMAAFSSSRATASCTKMRRSLILTSSSNIASAAAFASATTPSSSSMIAGTRTTFSAVVGGVSDVRPLVVDEISVKRRVKEARMHSSSARKPPISELVSRKFIGNFPYPNLRSDRAGSEVSAALQSSGLRSARSQQVSCGKYTYRCKYSWPIVRCFICELEVKKQPQVCNYEKE